MKGFTKADVEYHGYAGRMVPAVNVKVDLGGYMRQNKAYKSLWNAQETRPWVTEEQWNTAFYWACESGWEDLEEIARDIFGNNRYVDRQGATKYRINVYSEGRSGGWAIVDGIDEDVALWDAIALNRWAKFATAARRIADGVPQTMTLYVKQAISNGDYRRVIQTRR